MKKQEDIVSLTALWFFGPKAKLPACLKRGYNFGIVRHQGLIPENNQ